MEILVTTSSTVSRVKTYHWEDIVKLGGVYKVSGDTKSQYIFVSLKNDNTVLIISSNSKEGKVNIAEEVVWETEIFVESKESVTITFQN